MKRLALLTTLLLTLLGGLAMTEPQRAQAQTFSCNNVTEIPVAECNELVTLYNSTGGANWRNKTDWLTTNTPCSWFGLTCYAGHVSEINLFDDGNTTDAIFGNDLIGTIPNLNLPNLMVLDLSRNKLNGTIPNFSNLPNLTWLSLWDNQLSGPIPNFSNLPNLKELNFNSNQLSGTIPNLNWSSFQYLQFNNNCGLVAFDTAQAAVLTTKDPDWQVRNSICKPSLQVVKAANLATALIGDTITYTVWIRNNGTSTLNNIVLEDRLLSIINKTSLNMSPGSLSVLFVVTKTITLQDFNMLGDGGNITNIAHVTGTDVTDWGFDSNPVTITIRSGARLKLTQIGGATQVQVPAKVVYTYTVENNGTVGLTGITLTDDKLNLGIAPFDLLPNMVKVVTASTIFNQPGVTVTNLATAQALFGTTPVVATATWTVKTIAMPTPTNTPTNTPTATTAPPTDTPTATTVPATNTPTATTAPPTDTPTATTVPSPGGDSYEADNSCSEAKAITPDGLAQSHTFHAAGDEDWVKFEGQANVTYMIDVGVPDSSTADVVLVTYDKCNGNPTANDSFNPEIHLQFKAPSTGTYFMRLTNQESALGGEKFSYQISVRQLANQASPGAVVIVAGKLKANDPLQANIHQVTNQVYQLFTRYGYESERIYYLANDLKLNPDSDSTTQDVDDLAQRATLQRAITEWAVDKVGPERAFTLYMMDHGAEDKFYLNGREQVVSPDEVNTWLNALEAAAPGVRVNVIIDACYSGSFIKGTQRLGKVGRVIIASTTDQTSAYASPIKGAIFSDMFLQGLDQKLSLYDSFMEGHRVAKVWHPEQVAWLDGNGNGIPNETADFVVAQQRGFAYAGSLADDLYAPYIATATGPLKVENGQGTVTAQISDDVSGAKLDVWAVVYKPSYVPPQSEELVADMENLPTIKLNGPDSNQVYRGLYEGFNESGTYRLVIYAKDEDGLLSRPREVSVTVERAKVYLPVVVK